MGVMPYEAVAVQAQRGRRKPERPFSPRTSDDERVTRAQLCAPRVSSRLPRAPPCPHRNGPMYIYAPICKAGVHTRSSVLYAYNPCDLHFNADSVGASLTSLNRHTLVKAAHSEAFCALPWTDGCFLLILRSSETWMEDTEVWQSPSCFLVAAFQQRSFHQIQLNRSARLEIPVRSGEG